LEFIEHNPMIPREELADFLVVAARLLLIKSRALLPQVAFEAEEGGLSLEEQLKMYKQFADAAKRLEAVIKLRRFLFPREKPPLQPGLFSPPRGVSSERLAQVFREILNALEPIVRLPRAAIERTVSIQEKMAELRSLLSAQKSASFSSFIRAVRTKTEVVVSFLALLELVKQKLVMVDQEELFADIAIEHAVKVSR
jgi:segregation and condensation protein A